MSKFCKICGAEIESVDGKCPNAELHLKKMCFNCVSCSVEDDNCFCKNEDNLKDAVEAVKKNIPSGYELQNIELKPIALKDPTKKCKRWSLNLNTIVQELNSLV